MTQERGKLEPCPFCGGEAIRQDLTDDDNAGGSCIACDQCGASSPVHFDRKENLYDSWNRRSTSSAERGMREAAVALSKEVDRMWNDPHRFNPPAWESHAKAICSAQQDLSAALNPAGPA